MSKPATRAPGLDPVAVNPVDETAHTFNSDATPDDLVHFEAYEAGRIFYGTDQLVEYIAGSLPIIVTVPHGGLAAPAHIPKRIGGVHEPDIHTQELARLLQQAFAVQLGLPNAQPHMIINRLQRGRLDMNRNEQEATGGNPLTKKAWRQFHAFVRRAKREIVRGRSITRPASIAPISSAAAIPAAFCRGLCIDLHGQSHDSRHQLGYVLSENELATFSDAMLDDLSAPTTQALVDKCSLRIAIDLPGAAAPDAAVAAAEAAVAAAEVGAGGAGAGVCGGAVPAAHIGNVSLGPPRCVAGPTTLSEIVRGSKSLGGMLEALGHPCVPSPSSACAKGHYFNGGYNSHCNGSGSLGAQQRRKEREADRAAAALAPPPNRPVQDPDVAFTNLFDSTLETECFLAIQMETAYQGHRDSQPNMQRFANSMAKTLCQFADMHVLKEGEKFPTPQTQ